jgi:hypothetical protein
MLAANVPEWLAKSKQVATGNRRRVLEDGVDVMSSSDEDDPKRVPEKERGMYTSEMNPTADPRVLSEAEVMNQRMIAKANRAAGFPDPPQSFTLSTDAQMFPPVAAVDESVTRLRAVTDSRLWVLGMHHPAAGPRAVVRCSQVPRWGQTK